MDTNASSSHSVSKISDATLSSLHHFVVPVNIDVCDTVGFATEAFIDHLDMTMNLWKCANVGPAIICFTEWMVDVSERFDEVMNDCG